jgi:urease accessory protein
MSIDSLLSLLQFSDGLFPAGGYAHSAGLETCVQSGAVTDSSGVETFIRAHLEGVAGPTDAVILVCALHAAAAGNSDECFAQCLELDRRLDAIKAASEAREASRQMGRQIVRVAGAIVGSPVISAFVQAAQERTAPCHQAVIFGIVAAAFRWSPRDAAAAFLYSNTAQIVGAALRLIPMGQLDGQRIIARLGPTIGRLATDAAGRDTVDAWSFAPALEIAAMRHARLEARIFRS